ncbi:MAG: hypothetical protein ACLRQF_00925 [Thomasclavelia ramosa]
MTLIMTNIADAQAGKPLTYFNHFSFCLHLYGNSNILDYVIDVYGGSERYKKMLKLAFIPNLFNINEPLIWDASNVESCFLYSNGFCML